MLAQEGRGNQVFWGHRGLCCGEAEKASPTSQGGSCILAEMEGRVGLNSTRDQGSGIRAEGPARMMTGRQANQETKNGSLELARRIYKKHCVRRWKCKRLKLRSLNTFHKETVSQMRNPDLFSWDH